MNNTANVIFGYVLLFAGLALIVVPLYQGYQVISGKVFPPEVFKTSLPLPQSTQPAGQLDIQKQMEEAVQKALPVDLIIKTLNLTAWIALMLLFMFGGKLLAELGIRLMRT